jgi:hypothetical protein
MGTPPGSALSLVRTHGSDTARPELSNSIALWRDDEPAHGSIVAGQRSPGSDTQKTVYQF